jgi:hypothetical protein
VTRDHAGPSPLARMGGRGIPPAVGSDDLPVTNFALLWPPPGRGRAFFSFQMRGAGPFVAGGTGHPMKVSTFGAGFSWPCFSPAIAH